MVSEQENNKRIAKNTLLLYIRMFFLMFISLYTSRAVLHALGVTDFGLNNVVGGVVVMFSVISGTLNAAISRFLTYELGTENTERLKKIFSTSITIQIFFSFIIILFAEPIGLWFMHNKMVIPPERMYACSWVFHFSLVAFCINIISVPYSASVISHERMSAFAYIGILDAIMKLGIAYIILYSQYDRLIFYAFLIALLSGIDCLIYYIYCKKHFEECTYHFVWDIDLINKIFAFAGWNIIGASSSVLRDQGGNILINMFSGPTVNAARSIAMQVNNAVNGFVCNFMTAVNPQITKSYACRDYKYMFKLAFQGARLSYYMMLVLSLPIVMNISSILHFWLDEYPVHSESFVIFILLYAMLVSISGPLITIMLATGKIRNYQLVVGGLQLMNLPFSYTFLKYGFPPEMVIVVAILIEQVCLFARLYMLRKMVGLSILEYFMSVYINIIKVSSFSLIIPLLIVYLFNTHSLVGVFSNILICIFSVLFSVFYIGCNNKERQFVISKIKQRVINCKFIKI